MKYRYLIILVFISLFFSACGGGGSSKFSGKVRIMPLGDSITYDDAHAYYDKNGKDLVPAGKRTAYRSFLAYDLDDAGVNYDFVGSRRAGYDVEPKFDPDNEGYPGWDSWQIADKVYSFLDKNPADIVLLHIGTNNHDKDTTAYKGTEKILDEIKRWEKDNNKKVHIFVALVIDRWWHDYHLETYNAKLKEMLLDRNDPDITVVDMSTLLGSEDYLEYTHPNKSGYKKMADKWFEAIMDYL